MSVTTRKHVVAPNLRSCFRTLATDFALGAKRITVAHIERQIYQFITSPERRFDYMVRNPLPRCEIRCQGATDWRRETHSYSRDYGDVDRHSSQSDISISHLVRNGSHGAKTAPEDLDCRPVTSDLTRRVWRGQRLSRGEIVGRSETDGVGGAERKSSP